MRGGGENVAESGSSGYHTQVPLAGVLRRMADTHFLKQVA